MSGDGVVILTDLLRRDAVEFGHRHPRSIFDSVDVVTGANLPMMMKLAKSRTLARSEAVAAAVDAGRRYIIDAAGLLSGGVQRNETKACGEDAAIKATALANSDAAAADGRARFAPRSTFVNEKGLHARASARFAAVVEAVSTRRSP